MLRKLTVTARTIFSPPRAPQSSDCLGRRISRKAPRYQGWIYSQTRSKGPKGQLPLHLGPTKTSAKNLARSRSVRIGVVRFEKVWSPTCPLNGSFQSPNYPLKGFFHSPNGIFLVANGRMAADFSSPE